MSGTFPSAQTSAPKRVGRRSTGRRPIVVAVVCLIIGIAAYRWAPIGPGTYLLMGIAFALTGAILVRYGRISCLCLACALAACGLALGQTEAFYFPDHDIGQFTSRESTLAELELRVEQPPQRYAAKRPSSSDRQQLRCRVLKARTWAGWQAATGNITVWLGQAHSGLRVGSRFRAMGRLSRISAAMNPGEFNWAAYARRNRELASISVRGPGQMTIVGQDAPGPIQWLQAKARQYLDMGFADGPDHDLLRALLLGDHPPELTPIRENFRRTGTAHHLATSGMHVAVVALLAYTICRLLCWPPRRSAIIALGIMLLYGLVISPSPPIVRSILLAGAIGGGILLRRRSDALQLLALAMLVMLIYRPLDLLNAGFQLSFAAVASLMLFTEPLSELLSGAGEESLSLIPPHGRHSAVGRWIRHRIIRITATGLAAWLICAPLIAWHFRQFNPFAIAAGAILEPTVFLSIIGGALKIVLSLLMPFGATIWAAVARAPVSSLRWGVERLAGVPGMDLVTRSPPLWLLAAWYGSMLLLLMPWRRIRRTMRAGALTGCVVGCLLLLHSRASLPSGTVRLAVLSVGAGQCAVLELPHGHAVLFDAGSQAFDGLMRQCVDPYFRLRGIRQIDAIFISHPNRDHFSAVAEIVRRFGVGRVYVARQFIEEASRNASAARLLEQLQAMGHAPVEIAAGRRIPLDDETWVDVLWPDDSIRFHDNEASLVLMLRHGSRRILLTGDIQSAAQQSLLNHADRLQSDILIAPHHGSSEWTTARFVRQVDPKAIISSDDGTLTKKQRDFERLIGDRPLYRTGESGAVTIALPLSGVMTIHPFLKEAESPPGSPGSMIITPDRRIRGVGR